MSSSLKVKGGNSSILPKMNSKLGKCIFLSNRRTVAYNHLVITTGMKQPQEEFSVALQSLIEALRVQKKIPGAFIQKNVKTSNTPIYQPVIEVADSSELHHLDKLLHNYLPKETERGQNSLSDVEKRLFYLTS